MEVYRQGLIPKARQTFEASMASYLTGGSDAFTVISRLRAIIEAEHHRVTPRRVSL